MTQKNYESNHYNAIPWSMILGSDVNHHNLLQTHFKESINATAHYLGVSFTGLEHKLNKEGITFPSKESIIHKIRKCGRQVVNMTSMEIAMLLGCKQKAVSDVCRRNNIKYKKANPLDNLLGKKKGTRDEKGKESHR